MSQFEYLAKRARPLVPHESGQGLLGFVRGGDEFSYGRNHGDDHLGAWFGGGI